MVFGSSKLCRGFRRVDFLERCCSDCWSHDDCLIPRLEKLLCHFIFFHFHFHFDFTTFLFSPWYRVLLIVLQACPKSFVQYRLLIFFKLEVTYPFSKLIQFLDSCSCFHSYDSKYFFFWDTNLDVHYFWLRHFMLDYTNFQKYSLKYYYK